jgi:Domain of unknown function (DUF4126)
MGIDSLVLTLLTGLGLTTAAAFRLFIPLVISSIAARMGYLSLGSGFTWIASDAALIGFAIAAFLEAFAAYRRPKWHLLTLKMGVGTLLTATAVLGVGAVWQWGIGFVLGSGISLLVHFAMPFRDRADPIAVTVITSVAVLLSIIAVAIPLFAFGLTIVGVLLSFGRKVLNRWMRVHSQQAPD